MRKLEKTTRTTKEAPVGSLQRKPWYCRKNKGQHLFKLVIPTWYKTEQSKYSNPEDFYKFADSRKGSFYYLKVRYYECSLCGKKAIDSENRPDKKIRRTLTSTLTNQTESIPGIITVDNGSGKSIITA